MKKYKVIIIEWIPKAQQRHRHTRSGHTYDPSAKDKKEFLSHIKHLPNKPIDGPISLQLIFSFPWPKKWYRTGKYAGIIKEGHPIVHTKKPDIDNLEKFILDSLNKHLWTDDCLVWESHKMKIYGLIPGVTIITKQTEEQQYYEL